jgi:hypothetical protein
MGIKAPKLMAVFSGPSPRSVRAAVVLFALIWLAQILMLVAFSAGTFFNAHEQNAVRGLHLIDVSGLAWFALNGFLIVGLCSRNGLARTIELLITLLFTSFMVLVPTFKNPLFLTLWVVNVSATILLYLKPSGAWFAQR